MNIPQENTVSAPIEAKVTAATAAAYVASTALLTILTSVQDVPGLVSWMPAYLAPFVLSAIPTGITFIAGYQARHTPRTTATDPPTPPAPPTAPAGAPS